MLYVDAIKFHLGTRYKMQTLCVKSLLVLLHKYVSSIVLQVLMLSLCSILSVYIARYSCLVFCNTLYILYSVSLDDKSREYRVFKMLCESFVAIIIVLNSLG